MKIKIISASVRDGRESHNVALYIENWINQNTKADVQIIDLKKQNFPLFEERLSFMKEKPEAAVKFSQDIDEADAVIIVSPEYNGGYPASIKNAIDLLYNEWQQKPVGLALVSSGDMAGAQVTQQLQFILYKIGAYVAKARFHAGNVSSEFDDKGVAKNAEFYDRNMAKMWEELQFLIQAHTK